MRIWLDPGTALTAGIMVANGVAQIAGGSKASRTVRNQGEAQAQFYEGQIPIIDRKEREATLDLFNERNAVVGRAQAISAAQGGDLDVGIIGGIAGKYGMMGERIKLDADEQRWMLRSRAAYARQAGMDAAAYGDAMALKGFGSLAQGGYSLYKTIEGEFGGSAGAGTNIGSVASGGGAGEAFGAGFGDWFGGFVS